MVFCPRCDGCYKHGLYIILVKSLMWDNLPYSYGYFERALLSTQKAWIHSNMDPHSTWCEYFEFVVLFFQDHNDIQCSMDYGLAHGSQSNVYTLEKDFLQCVIMCLTFWVHEVKIDFDWNYKICERWENFLNLDFHENKIVEFDLWAFELVICTFTQCFYFIHTFSYDDVITTWIEEKARVSLDWCLQTIVTHCSFANGKF
jgi:hypothetical protein